MILSRCNLKLDMIRREYLLASDGEKIFIDFSPKGGPKDLVGEWREDVAGVRFPDGNVWSKL